MQTSTSQVPITESVNRSSVSIPGQYRLIPNEIQMFLDILLYPVLSGSLSLFGIVGNSINIAVFWKQGLSESANICLLTLSIYDLGICVFSIFVSTCAILVRFGDTFTSTAMLSILVLAGAWPRDFLMALSMRTTVLLAVERCFCVVQPLHVKRLFSRKNTFTILILLYIDIIPLVFAVYTTYTLQWWHQGNKTSLMVLDVSDNGQIVLRAHYVFNNLTITILSVVIVSTCNVVMIAGVRRSQSFKQSAYSNQSQQHKTVSSLSTKETKLIRLVSYITTIFICCYIPYAIVVTAELIEPELNEGKRFNNMSNTLYGILYVFASVNTSVNIIAYLNVSSNYKKVLLELFGFGGKKV